ncbi:MAG: hypothetical protein CMH55_04450 [Myxococcales bacterium]|nr:hypothetical protein [Myxococcales bacterium]
MASPAVWAGAAAFPLPALTAAAGGVFPCFPSVAAMAGRAPLNSTQAVGMRAKSARVEARAIRCRLAKVLRLATTSPMDRLLLLALLLTACAEQRETEALVVLLDSAPESLDPRRGSSAVETRTQQLIFRGLVHLSDDLSIQPDLAKTIDTSQSGRIRIQLRSGQRFHNCYDDTKGGMLKAEDVIYSYESIRDPQVESRKLNIWADLKGVTAPDPKGLIVDFELQRDLPNWLEGNGTLGILEKSCAEIDPKAFARHPSGTGPLAFAQRIGDREIHLQRFEPSLAFERLILRVVKDENTRILEMLKGRSHVLLTTPARPLLAVLARESDLKLLNQPGLGYSYLGLNLEVPALGKKEVRRALALAIDRPGIIKHKYLGLARPSVGMMPPQHWAHASHLEPMVPDLRQAAALLASVDYRTNPDLLDDPTGNDERKVLRLELRCTPEKASRALALVLKGQLHRIGVEVDLRVNDFPSLFQQVKRRNFQMVRMEWTEVRNPMLLEWVFHSDFIPEEAGPPCRHHRDCPGAYESGNETKRRYSCTAKVCSMAAGTCGEGCRRQGASQCEATEPGLCRRAGGNRGSYSRPRVDELIDQARGLSGEAERKPLFDEIQRLLAEDLPYISLWHEDRVWVVNTAWQGIVLKPSGSFTGLLGAKRREP